MNQLFVIIIADEAFLQKGWSHDPFSNMARRDLRLCRFYAAFIKCSKCSSEMYHQNTGFSATCRVRPYVKDPCTWSISKITDVRPSRNCGVADMVMCTIMCRSYCVRYRCLTVTCVPVFSKTGCCRTRLNELWHLLTLMTSSPRLLLLVLDVILVNSQEYRRQLPTNWNRT